MEVGESLGTWRYTNFESVYLPSDFINHINNPIGGYKKHRRWKLPSEVILVVGLLVILLAKSNVVNRGHNATEYRGELHKKGEPSPSSCCNID